MAQTDAPTPSGATEGNREKIPIRHTDIYRWRQTKRCGSFTDLVWGERFDHTFVRACLPTRVQGKNRDVRRAHFKLVSDPLTQRIFVAPRDNRVNQAVTPAIG